MTFQRTGILVVALAAILSVAQAQDAIIAACQDKLDTGSFTCDENEDSGVKTVACTKWKDGVADCADQTDELHPCETDTNGGRKTDATFTCTNTEVIPCIYWNDGFRDCTDNSDEGYIYACPSKGSGANIRYQFKCTQKDAKDFETNFCESSDHLNDTDGDCPDDTDEQKFIGDYCVDLQPCDKFMPESFCNSNNQCECKSGRKVILRGADCALRVLGDVCETRADCWDSYAGMVCDDTHKNCTCEVGWNPNTEFSNATFCIANKIYDPCTVNAECSTPVPNSVCVVDQCVCEDVYLVDSATNASCNIRVLGDSCSSDTQCQFGMTYSKCGTNNTCECQTGSFANDDNTDCIRKAIDENCTQESDCALVTKGFCDTSTDPNTCQCTSDNLIEDYRKFTCADGLGDLYCDSDNNCTLHFDNSVCVDNICLCTPTYYEQTVTSCSRIVLGAAGQCGGNDDCVHLPNAECELGTATCVCIEGFSSTDGSGCVSGAASLDCSSFACQYPWAIALLVIGLLGIAVVIVILIIKRPWRKPEDEEKVAPGGEGHIPYSNGGKSGQNGAVPARVWNIRPKSSNPVMYDDNHTHLRDPADPEIDQFFNGGKKKAQRHGILPPIEGSPRRPLPTPADSGVFVFRGQGEGGEGGERSPRRTATPSNVRDDGFHTCGFETDDGTKCAFRTDSYYRMRMHKKETSHFIRESWPNKKNKKRKPRKLAPLEEETVGQVWSDEEEDDATLAALNQPATARVESPEEQVQPNGIGRHIALAFASLEEPMDTEDTQNLISDEEGDNLVQVLPQGSVHPHGPPTPEPTGVMSPGDISVTNVNDSPAIAEVARANSQTDGHEGQDSSDDDDEEDEEAGGPQEEGAAAPAKGGKKKGGKGGKGGKKGKGGKGGKKEKGGKKGKKDGDGKKEKKKGGKDKKGGGKGSKKNKNNNNRNVDTEDDDDVGNDGASQGTMNESERLPYVPQTKAPKSWIERKLSTQQSKTPRTIQVHDLDSGNLEFEPLDGDPLQYTRRGEKEEERRGTQYSRPESRCSMRSPVDTVVIPMPAQRQGSRNSRVAFNTHHSVYP